MPVPKTSTLPSYLSAAQLAALLQTQRGQIHRWIRAGHLRAIRIGKLVRIERGEVDRFLAAHQVGGDR